MKVDINKYRSVFLLGIGGIGMSALARYLQLSGLNVAGYDRSATPLTGRLESEGITIFYHDSPALTSNMIGGPDVLFVISTPAIQPGNQLLKHFIENKYLILKRSVVLGILTEKFKTIAIAGTHGKTTVSIMLSHLLYSSKVGCTAFTGGISKNYDTNFLHNPDSEFAVTEADEFDRSFLQLHPFMGAITSVDADHLDIYNTYDELLRTFNEFANQFDPRGILVVKLGVPIGPGFPDSVKKITYACDDNGADVYADNIQIGRDHARFDLVIGDDKIRGLQLGITGLMNVENAVVASYLALQAGVSGQELRDGLKSFSGVKRRFDLQFTNENLIYLDDYAHHPKEILALVNSVKSVYPGKRVTGIFQPHLYSRTKDFADEFAESLSLLDEVILLDIYPARELPVEGVSSKIIFDKIPSTEKVLCSMDEVMQLISNRSMELLLTIGAGDIDQLVPKINLMLNRKFNTD